MCICCAFLCSCQCFSTQVCTQIPTHICVCLLIISRCFHRQYHYEQKLQSIMWKVDLREVTFLGNEYNAEEAYRIGNIAQFFRHRTMRFITGESNRRAYTTIGRSFFINGEIINKHLFGLFSILKASIEETSWL